jgi:S-DNA-T family DNA segregation ATPase FtsK/SpoIIIE
VHILTPSGNRRLNELIGFMGITLAILMALSLLSYSPNDGSLDVAAPLAASPARNWIGPAGAHLADLLFQIVGYAAFLFPAGMAIFGLGWFRSRVAEAPIAKSIGALLLLIFVPAELSMIHTPLVRGALPAGGLVGTLTSGGLRGAFNPVGAHLVALAAIIVAIFLTTPFSFFTAAERLKKPIASQPLIGNLIARWRERREARQAAKLKQRVEAIKLEGRPPVPRQRIPGLPALEDEDDERTAELSAPPLPSFADSGALSTRAMDREAQSDSGDDVPVVTFSNATARGSVARRSSIEPKITRGKTSYRLPSPDLLHRAERREKMDESELKEFARAIEIKAQEFGVQGRITQINPGPVVTTFEFKPEAGIKYSRITGLSEDLCLALKAESILIERIPGKATVGIEVPNPRRETIALREVIESPEFVNSPSKLTVPLGKDLIGRIRAADLTQMPHVLIAGATGTGKSVFLNSMLMAMLYKSTPEELKLVLVDPKRLELGLYEGIPHLFTPVVTDPKVASNVLRNTTKEMERRLKLLAQRGVRNIDQYNRTFQKAQSLSLFDNAEESEHQPLPYLVIVIDELADLMMVDTTNVEESITRLAQMARAVGIHLILATQRPSVDVITGLIKANFPARISFRVASKVDSRTILDSNGSESLLGKGDMLYLPAGSSRLHRIHGPLVTEDEISALCDFWRNQAKAIYNKEMLKPPKDENSRKASGGARDGDTDGVDEEVDDELYEDAIRVVCEMGRASTSTLQRRLRVGYGRAARLIDLMQKDGIVGPPDGAKPREVLKKKDWMREYDQSVR